MKKAVDELVLSEETKRTLIKQARDTVEQTLNSMSDEIAGKAEIQLEKLSNEKVMMVHDYSDTVLEEVGKNHHEVMFLYSMLDDKDKDIKNTVREAQKIIKTMQELNQTQERVNAQIQQQSERLEENLKKDLNERKDKSLERDQKGSIEKENRVEKRGRSENLVGYQREEELEDADGSRKTARYLERMPKGYQEKSIDRNQEKMPDPYRERNFDKEPQEKPLEGKKKRSGKRRRKAENERIGWSKEAEYLAESEESREVYSKNESENKKRDTVIRLCKLGKSNLEIAKEMGLSMGEVKLMIDLYYVPEESKGTIE